MAMPLKEINGTFPLQWPFQPTQGSVSVAEMSPWAQERSSSETNSSSLPSEMRVSSGCVWGKKPKMRHMGWAWQLAEVLRLGEAESTGTEWG